MPKITPSAARQPCPSGAEINPRARSVSLPGRHEGPSDDQHLQRDLRDMWDPEETAASSSRIAPWLAGHRDRRHRLGARYT